MDTARYIERDISWMFFNERILLEAENEANPLFKRIKFLAIYSSNLDEFFRVRVAMLRRLSKISKKNINNQLGIEPARLKSTFQSGIDHPSAG